MWQTPNSKHDSNTQFSRTLFHSFDQNEDEEKFLNQPFIQDSFNSVHSEKLEHLNSPIKGETQTLKQYKSTEDLEKFKNLQEIKNNNPYFRERTISDERNFLIARAKKFHKNCKINLLSMLIYFVILVISQSFLFSYVRNTDLEDPKSGHKLISVEYIVFFLTELILWFFIIIFFFLAVFKYRFKLVTWSLIFIFINFIALFSLYLINIIKIVNYNSLKGIKLLLLYGIPVRLIIILVFGVITYLLRKQLIVLKKSQMIISDDPKNTSSVTD